MQTPDPHAASRLESIFDVLAGRVVIQERKYGPFEPDIAGVRLGLAVLQDELTEALHAWRDERRVGGWEATADEIADVAGVALRLLAAIDGATP